jgi:hypothetical protein
MGKFLTWVVGAKAAGQVKAGNGHPRPSRCRDRDCLRPLCMAYKDGREDGYEDGYDDGREDGYRAGFAAGSPLPANSEPEVLALLGISVCWQGHPKWCLLPAELRWM